MCCDRQHLKPELWGYSCVHCGMWLNIGRKPAPEEIALDCEPCESCKRRTEKQANNPRPDCGGFSYSGKQKVRQSPD